MKMIPLAILAMGTGFAATADLSSLAIPDLKLPAIPTRADRPLPAFPHLKIEIPTISPTGIVEQDSPVVLSNLPVHFRDKAPAVQARKLVSHMPLLSPRGDIDPKMSRFPNANVDDKLIVHAPELAPAP